MTQKRRNPSNRRSSAVAGVLFAAVLMTMMASPSQAYRRPGTNYWASAPQEDPLVEVHLREAASCPNDFGPPSISANGRYIAFASLAADLVSNDEPLVADIFVHDLSLGTTELASVSSSGQPAHIPAIDLPGVAFDHCPDLALSGFPSISANGRFVAFQSYAENLVEGDTNHKNDIFVHDRLKRRTVRVSVSSAGQEWMPSDGLPPLPSGHLGSFRPSISSNGRVVAFTSVADNLVPEDDNEVADTFIHDLKTHITQRASIVPDSTETIEALPPKDVQSEGRPSVSGDGRFVVFDNSKGSFRRDMKAETTIRVDLNSKGEPGSFPASLAGLAEHRISDDGRFVVFSSTAHNLVPNDTNCCLLTHGDGGQVGNSNTGDVFVRDIVEGRTERVSITSDGSGQGNFDSGSSEQNSISANGRYIVYTSKATTLTGSPEQAESGGGGECGATFTCDPDVFLYDRRMGTTEQISLSPTGGDTECPNSPATAGCFSWLPITRDGRSIAYETREDGLDPADHNGEADIYVYDRGPDYGIGGFDGDEHGASPPEDKLCISSEVCVPPEGAIVVDDEPDSEALLGGSDLLGAGLAHRSRLGDLFIRLEVQDMPRVSLAPSPMIYGLRFQVANRSYEVRATSTLGGTFGLFDCTNSLICTKVADLLGGYGTTGARVVFSLPLEEIGLQDGGELSDVEAFSALGSYYTGAAKVLDTVGLD